MECNEIQILIDKYLCGLATEAERKLVDAWYDSFNETPGFTQQLSEEEHEAYKKESYTLLIEKLKI